MLQFERQVKCTVEPRRLLKRVQQKPSSSLTCTISLLTGTTISDRSVSMLSGFALCRVYAVKLLCDQL